MECKKCGTPSVDGAVFCSNCGARLDNKKPCPACGKIIEETAAFCIYCGKRLDGKNACSACGEVFEGKFCPKCGKAAVSAQNISVKPKKIRAQGEGKETAGWTKIVSNCGSAALAIGTLLAMIFVFLIGGVLEGMDDYYSQTVQTALKENSLGMADNIFYFFGQVYKDIDKVDFVSSSFYEGLFEDSANTYAIVGTVSTVIVMLAVVIFGILALVQYFRSVLGYTQRKTDKWAILCILSFFVGVGIFFMLNQGFAEVLLELSESEDGFSVDRKSRSMGIEYSLNGASVCGLIFCFIFLLLGVACLVARKGVALRNKNTLTKLLVAVGSVVLITVVFSLLANLGVALEASLEYTDSYYDDYYEYTIVQTLSGLGELDLSFSNFNIIAAQLSSLSNEVLAGADYKEFTESLETTVVCFNMSTVFVVLTLCVGAWTLFERIKGMINGTLLEGRKSSVSLLVLVVIAATTFFVGGVNAMNAVDLLLDGAGISSNRSYDLEYSFGLAGMIVSIVLALLNVLLPVVQKAVSKSAENKAAKVYEDYVD